MSTTLVTIPVWCSFCGTKMSIDAETKRDYCPNVECNPQRELEATPMEESQD